MVPPMRLVFIHGAPGSGKLTTAKALLGHVRGRLFDNHAAIDVARNIYDFGAPGFSELIHEVRFGAQFRSAEPYPACRYDFCVRTR